MPISQYDQLQYAAYKPLSMQEIWAPAQQMRDQHDKLQEEYAQQELLGGAASLGLQQGVDDKAIADNKSYMDAIKSATDELSTKGFIDSGRRRQLIGLKNQYAQTVLPIQNALKVRQEAIDFDKKMKAHDQTYRSTFDPSRVAVTDYLKNNQAFTPQGISVGTMSKDAANEFSQLKNMVSQKYPTLSQSGVIGTLWTKVNSGVPLEDIAGFIKNEAANKNIDPKVLSALVQEMHNIVENNLQKHGAYKAFGNDPKAINELRSSVANMAIYSLGDPKFGQMNDPMAVARAQAALTPPPDDGLMDEERYNPDYDKKEIQELSSIRKSAEGRNVVSDDEAIALMKTMRILAEKYPNIKEYQIPDDMTPAQYRVKIGQTSKEQAINKVVEMGKSLNIWQKGSRNFEEYADKVIEAQKEKFKTSNKVKTISKIDNDIVGGILNSVLTRSNGELLDANGSSFKIDNNSSASKSVDFDFKKGMYLSIPGEDGKIHSVPFEIDDLNIKSLTEDYNLIAGVESGKYKYSDIKIDDNEYMNKDTYKSFKNQTAKAIRHRLSLKPEATAVKPKL